MTKFHKGIAPIILIVLIALGLAGGATAGYEFREPIKKAVTGLNTKEEIQKAVDAVKLDQSKFQLEGVATSVDVTGNILTVKIKSSTASIKELRLSETPITVATSTQITSGTLTNLKINDIPINSQVHVGGSITDGVLTATKIIVQKDEAIEMQTQHFVIGGLVKEIGTNQVSIDVKSANKTAKGKISTTIVVKTDSATVFQKDETIITLTDLKVNDNVHIIGTVSGTDYLASKIQVRVLEEATEIEEPEADTTNTKVKTNNANVNSNAGGNSANSNANSANSNAGGNSTNSNRGGNANQ